MARVDVDAAQTAPGAEPITTPLGDQMRALADGGHPRAIELNQAARAFELANWTYWATTQPDDLKKMMGAWARARRIYGECSGESLV